MEEQKYQQIFNFLLTQNYPHNFNSQQKQQLKRQANNFEVLNNLLYKIDKNNKSNRIRVVRPYEMEAVLYMFHNDPLAAH